MAVFKPKSPLLATVAELRADQANAEKAAANSVRKQPTKTRYKRRPGIVKA